MECEMVSLSLRNNNEMNVFITIIDNSYQSKTFMYMAGRYWNRLPRALQNICDLFLFKVNLKKFINGSSFIQI